MKPLALTPGMESRLSGAPETELDAQELEAAAAYFQTQGMEYEEALQEAMRHLAARKQSAATREATLAQESQASQQAWDNAGMDTRSTQLLGQEQDDYQNLAAQVAGGYRNDGPLLRPDTEAWRARDLLQGIRDVPYQREATGDPIDDELALRQGFLAKYQRNPRNSQELDEYRKTLIFNYQTDGGQRTTRQAPGRWGSQQPFKSAMAEEGYQMSSPGQPSQLEADMFAADTPMVLVYKNGRAGPEIAAPAPLPGQPYLDADGTVQMAADGLPQGVANAAFLPSRQGRAGLGTNDPYPLASVRTGMRSADLLPPREGALPRLVDGPSGPQWVWGVPKEQADEDRASLQSAKDRAAMRRYAAELGVPVPADGQEGASLAGLREQALAKRDRDRVARRNEARRIQTENAQMNSGQPGLQMQQMDPGFRQVMLLDRLTQGRRGGATPLDVQAQNMENAMPIVRSAVAGAVQGMDPQARARQEMQTRAAIIAMPPEQQVAFSRMQGDPIGTGYSAAHVGGRWNYWLREAWVSGDESKLEGFRGDMETLGYTPAEIDAFIAARLNAPEGPEAAPSSPKPEPSNRVPVPQGGRRGRAPSSPFKLPPSGGGRGRSGTLPRNRG